MGEMQSLLAGAVSVGDELPPLPIEVSATTVILGAMATRDWRPMHHDVDFAVNRNGVRNIFMNTPNLAAWFERYLTDWSGPRGRLGRMKFRMRDSIFPGDTMVFGGTVTGLQTDDTGCCWAEVAVQVTVGDRSPTDCTAKIALPSTPDDNPWKRRDGDWQP